ncbi:BBE domain-containing protein [Streptosporangium fragile]|uniref:BBE domain-containing protein n=1 Tax=Streptosporangium fragile TaxID=46186 RepID=A0ABN3W9D9_9ACTN
MVALAGLTRRGFLGGTLTGGSVLVGGPVLGARPEAAAACPPPLGAVTVDADDPRYGDLVSRGRNGRFAGRPQSVHVVGSTEQVVRIVGDAVRAGKRIAVRSGGHCYENFVDDPGVQVLIDLSEMKAVYFDPARKAFAVEGGATLGQLYRTLYLGWGVTVPGGACPSVGVGGHLAGGGYGPLSRRYGLAADHLHAVEVVVVDGTGRARAVVATGSPSDPNRDLWWAHTGGGGGNFGIVTRYWLRSPDARGADPSGLLPAPPGTLLSASVTWQWEGMTEEAFTGLVRTYGAWHAENTGPDSPYAGLMSGLTLAHRENGPLTVNAALDGGLPGADGLMDRFVAAMAKGTDVPHTSQTSTSSWLKATLSVPQGIGTVSFKTKSGFLRRPWSDRQIAVVHRFLTESGGDRWGTSVNLTLLGGRMNAVESSATAMPHRDALFSAVYETMWGDPAGGERQLAWIREFYRELHADTGGVPAPGPANAGAYINYPDVDLADPRWNTSGVPWHTLYYGGNYPALRRAKRRWDPRDVFRHALSIRAEG